ncbi:MAG: hypothetical protein HRU15_05350, partial [Planctomycetes bacterium]|nr:hypothetical protein [Planctomycetota bacterium]
GLDGKLVVSYSGKSYIAENGNLIVDAREAKVSGPMHKIWSPDSFTIDADGVYVIDDYLRDSNGVQSPVGTN